MKSHLVAWIALAISIVSLALVITQMASDASTFAGARQKIQDDGGGQGGGEAACIYSGGQWICNPPGSGQNCTCVQ